MMPIVMKLPFCLSFHPRRMHNDDMRSKPVADVQLWPAVSVEVLCRACQNPDGSEDLKKGTQLLEVYALEIQMYTEQKNTKRLKQLYHKALTVKSAIPHPRIMGIIRECGGKMHMHERIWSEAATDFFEVGHLGNASCQDHKRHAFVMQLQPTPVCIAILIACLGVGMEHETNHYL